MANWLRTTGLHILKQGNVTYNEQLLHERLTLLLARC